MANLKDTFVPLTIILSSEINQNFTRLNEQDKFNKDLTSQIDGIVKQFTTPDNYEDGSLRVYLDGVRQTIVTDYGEDGDNIHFTFTSATAPVVGQSLVVDYRKKY